MKKILFASFLLGFAALAGDHNDPSPDGGGERAIDSSGRKPGSEKASRYLACNEQGVSVSNTPTNLGANRLVRALVVTSANKSWKLAAPKDAEEGFVECATVVANQNGVAVGRYSPTFKSQFGCDSEPFVSSVPGGLIYPNSPVRESIRYFPIRPPGAPEGSEMFDWVPTPCGMQDEDALLAMRDSEGREEVVSYESEEKRNWTLAASNRVEDVAIKLLKAQALVEGPFGEASRQCLAKRTKASPSAAVAHIAPVSPISETSKPETEIVTPFSPPAVNTNGDQRAPAEFFDD